MKRDRLIRLTSNAAAARGYAFHTGEEHLAGSTVRVYPAAWLVPPAVDSHTGRREGETRYRLVLHLMALPAGAVPAETAWRNLESDALGIAADLACSPEVCSVAAIKCTLARQSLTPHGETSLTLECEVTMWYTT
jgi:hypothetical protein